MRRSELNQRNAHDGILLVYGHVLAGGAGDACAYETGEVVASEASAVSGACDAGVGRNGFQICLDGDPDIVQGSRGAKRILIYQTVCTSCGTRESHSQLDTVGAINAFTRIGGSSRVHVPALVRDG